MNSYQRGQKALCGDYFKFTPNGADQFKRAGRWHTKPQAGDVSFYFSTEKNKNRIAHVGIVDNVIAQDLEALEGNTSGAERDRNGGEVRKKRYTNFKVAPRAWICGFGRPVYGDDTCTVEELLEVARQEVGYEEKTSPHSLDDKHTNRGNKNYTKYGAWYNGGKALSEYWCAEFVSWCFYQACKLHQERKASTVQQEPHLEGWKQQNDKWLYYKDNVPVWGGFHYVNGRWYAFDNAGFMIKGWFKTAEGWYYLGEDGGMLSSQWLEDKGKWYYLTKTGLMATNAKVKKAKGDGFDYVGEDGAYDGFKSLFTKWTDRVEVVE